MIGMFQFIRTKIKNSNNSYLVGRLLNVAAQSGPSGSSLILSLFITVYSNLGVLGSLSIALALSQALAAVSLGGITVAAIREISVPYHEGKIDIAGKIILRTLIVTFSLATISSLIVFIGLTYLSNAIFNLDKSYIPYIKWATPLIILNVLISLAQTCLRISSSFGSLFVGNILIQPCSFIVLAFFFKSTLCDHYWVIPWITSLALQTVFLWYALFSNFPIMQATKIKSVFQDGLRAWINSRKVLYIEFVKIFNNWGAILLLVMLCSKEDIGIYRLAVQFAAILSILYSGITSANIPIIARQIAIHRLDDAANIMYSTGRMALSLAAPAILLSSGALVWLSYYRSIPLMVVSCFMAFTISNIIVITCGPVGEVLETSISPAPSLYMNLGAVIAIFTGFIFIVPSGGILWAASIIAIIRISQNIGTSLIVWSRYRFFVFKDRYNQFALLSCILLVMSVFLFKFKILYSSVLLVLGLSVFFWNFMHRMLRIGKPNTGSIY